MAPIGSKTKIQRGIWLYINRGWSSVKVLEKNKKNPISSCDHQDVLVCYGEETLHAHAAKWNTICANASLTVDIM